MEGPLTELRNQRLPRRKMMQTYGKRKAGGKPTTEKSRRELFGEDEGGLEKQLADLSLDTTEKEARSQKGEDKNIDTTEKTSTTGKDGKKAASTESKPSLISQEDADVIKPLVSLAEGNVEPFSTFGAKLAKSFDIEKIGEGSFAEVFKLSTKSPSTSESQSQSQSIQLPSGGAIIKIIPLKHPSSDPLTVDRTSTIDSVAREIRVFRTLDSIHGFTRFRGMRLVTGPWAKPFLTAFRKFRTLNRKRALNRAPDDDFSESQIYAIIEMGDAGSELFLMKRPSAFQAYDIFWSSVILFANAEEQIEFEHRDLHLSNLCIKPRALPEKASDEEVYEYDEESIPVTPHLDIDPELLKSMSAPPEHRLGLSSLKVTIIDYTISRCKLAPTPSPDSTTPQPVEEEIAYDPLTFLSPTASDPEDHLETTSKEDALQFRTYRKTRAVALHHAAHHPSSGDKWSCFLPQTNVLWLGYLITSLRRRAQGRISPTNWPDRPYVLKDSSPAAKDVQTALWAVLGEVEDAVGDKGDDGSEWSDDDFDRLPAGARELLARGVECGWITTGEIEAFKRALEDGE